MVGEGGVVTARLIVADEHPVVRRAVRLSCDALPGLQVVGEADTGFDVLSLCEELRPDVAVLSCDRLNEEHMNLQRPWRPTLQAYLQAPFFDQYRLEA